jgi:hypothetical protein
MGGLAVQRALLDDKGLRNRTSHLFLFGTPCGGLIKASLVRVLNPQLRDMARFCRQAEANELAPDRKWRLATQGEALLVLGQKERAYICYSQAADPALEAAPRELKSMYQQAICLSRLIGDQSMRRELTRIFRQGEE